MAARNPREQHDTDPQNLETDVLIVGAGPVGLLAANALVEKSIETYICDKLNAPVEEYAPQHFIHRHSTFRTIGPDICSAGKWLEIAGMANPVP